jgi:hypothetical protein
MALGWLFLNSMAPNSAEKSARDSFELPRDRSQEVASNNPQSIEVSLWIRIDCQKSEML